MTGKGAVLLIGMVLAQADPASAPPGFVVTITGTGHFDGLCTLDGAHQPVRLTGHPPVVRRLDGQSISCRFEATGPLTVSIEDGRGRRARSATSGGRLGIAIR